VLVALRPAAVHFAWQVATLAPGDGANALRRFRSNRYAGLLIFLACLVVGQTSF
jgi:4-hydroxybenzoate polyprenyltransferase